MTKKVSFGMAKKLSCDVAKKLSFGLVMGIVLFGASASRSFAHGGDPSKAPEDGSSPIGRLGRDTLGTILSHVPRIQFRETATVCSAFGNAMPTARRIQQELALREVQEIEAIMNKFGPPIPLPATIRKQDGRVAAQINRAGVTQELWVKILGYNPSFFKEMKYCPGKDKDGYDEYQEVVVDGAKVSMCKDFPVDRVTALSNGQKDSDEEFYKVLNEKYRMAGLPDRFRRATRGEYFWADVAGYNLDGTPREPKVEADADLDHDDPRYLGKFMPYYPDNNFGPSGERQPRPITENLANSYGFRRAGVWEWVDEGCVYLTLVGGSWNIYAQQLASGYQVSSWLGSQFSIYGSSRPVRTR